MKRTTKADMARELDSLRHRVSQQAADIERLADENAILRSTISGLRSESAVLRSENAVHAANYSSRRDAMRAAREQAMATGQSVKVQS